jgi:N utilization substance protein A
MDIDMSALRLLEREREIPLDLLIPTIEQALLVAYHKTPGPSRRPVQSWTARAAT